MKLAGDNLKFVVSDFCLPYVARKIKHASVFHWL